MLATAHYSFPDNAIELVAQCELSGYVTFCQLLEAVGRKFSHRHGNPAAVGPRPENSSKDTSACPLTGTFQNFPGDVITT